MQAYPRNFFTARSRFARTFFRRNITVTLPFFGRFLFEFFRNRNHSCFESAGAGRFFLGTASEASEARRFFEALLQNDQRPDVSFSVFRNAQKQVFRKLDASFSVQDVFARLCAQRFSFVLLLFVSSVFSTGAFGASCFGAASVCFATEAAG